VDGQGRLFVADSCNHRIQVFSADGKWLASYGSAGSGKGQMSYPYDVRVDNAGFQFVCEFGNSRIQVFDPQHQPGGSDRARRERARRVQQSMEHRTRFAREFICRGCAEPSRAKTGAAKNAGDGAMNFQFTSPHFLWLLPVAWAWAIWLTWKSDAQLSRFRRGLALPCG
jgi:hypothetical protein